MFRLNQHVAQIITRETGDVVRIDKVLATVPPANGNPPSILLVGCPERRYDAFTGQEIESQDIFIVTRVVPLELP